MIRNKAVQDQHESAQSSCPNEFCKNAAYSLACGLFHGQVFMKSTLMCALRKATRWLLQSVGRIVITSRKAWALESSLIHVLVGEGKLAYLRLHNSVIFWGDSKTEGTTSTLICLNGQQSTRPYAPFMTDNGWEFGLLRNSSGSRLQKAGSGGYVLLFLKEQYCQSRVLFLQITFSRIPRAQSKIASLE